MIWNALKRLFGFRADAATADAGPDAPALIPCEEALERMYEFMDGELDGASREEVAAHFEACARCYPHLRFEERFRERVQRAVRRPEVPADLRRRVLEILDEA